VRLMYEINNLLLKIYHASQNTAVVECPDKVFLLLKNQINVDVSGLCDFNKRGSSGIKRVSAAHQMSMQDKVGARQGYREQEIVLGQKINEGRSISCCGF